MNHPETIRVVDGVLHVGDRPAYLLCTDYPYFRDDPANWEDRLRAQREADLRVLTLYVPWRHHAPEDPLHGGGGYDFSGRTQPNRNLLGLLDLAAAEGLLVVLKPGPFVHAELPYGGLPEYVRPDRNRAIEPELNKDGEPLVWSLREMPAEERHPLPAPFGEAYVAYVRDWFLAFAREVLAPHFHPRGPVVGVQLMNEGVYSDSSRAEPGQLGYASSTVEHYRNFLRDSYRTLEEYNETHRADVRAWEDVEPPTRPQPLADPRELLTYMDWSVFQSTLYFEVARLYKRFLVEGGMPEDAPVMFNFNPNGDTYRTKPAANDGWYTRVNAASTEGFVFGATNWIGTVAQDPQAYRQYVMAFTAHRGPAMEQNWGFSTLYDPTFAGVTASHFETLLATACGATGATVYTMAGTRAWRDDPNLQGAWIPPRTSHRLDETQGDYPGDASIDSAGRRHPKYWTLRQIAQYLNSEGHGFLAHGPVAGVAWGIYPRYACSGQWLPRGDADDLLWRPPLKAVPRGAYHGLDAFVEAMNARGLAFGQIDVSKTEYDLSRYPVLCVSSHEFMGIPTQERLVDHVERGGHLLLTGLVPDRDHRLNPREGPFAERLFPHEVVARHDLPEPTPVEVDGERAGVAMEYAFEVDPPPDADLPIRVGGRLVGYRRRLGRGSAIYLGFGPWRARHSGDNPRVAAASQRLVGRLLDHLAGNEIAPARPLTAPGEVEVWQHGDPDADYQQLFVVVKEASGEIEVEFTRPGGRRERLTVTSPPQTIQCVAVEDGRLRAAYLRGRNDLTGDRVAPRVRLGDEEWAAEDACDLCVTPTDEGRALEVTVAHAAAPRVPIRLTIEPPGAVRIESENGEPPTVRREGGRTVLTARNVHDAGAYRVALPSDRRVAGPRAHMKTG